jgi:formylglycine-generating enzyme required for sulfatase activity
VCANASVLPWTDASYSEAKTACENSGRRLCTAAEMQEACVGVAQSAFPYGNSYDGQKCDGLDYTGSTTAPVKTGSLLGCVSQQTAASTTDGVFDLSGNVNEWTSTVVGNTGAPANLPIQALQGGSFLSPANGLTCGFSLDRISTNAVLPSLGFRCCKDP